MTPRHWLAAAAVALPLAWWLWAADARSAAQPTTAAAPAVAPAPRASAGSGAALASSGANASLPMGAPLSPLGMQQRAEQRQAAAQRLEQARQALEAYTTHTRYPPGSRPAREHPDQLRPFDPIVQEHPLRTPGGTASQGVKLVTRQDRVFLSGAEVSQIGVRLEDAQGNALPLQINRAVFHEVTEPGRTAQTAERAMALQSDGAGGWTALLAPAHMGFATFAGRLRLELWMQHGGQPGYTYFDLVYSPGEAARWRGGFSEQLVNGHLRFLVPVEVLQAGRYVASVRVDDARGQPVAVLLFNDELRTGLQHIAFTLHGRLVHDAQPAMPLRLRDLDAFLLHPDAFPDRVTLPRLAGELHRSQPYPLERFSSAEWTSDERARYLTELGKDVDEAQGELKRLGGP